MAMTQDVQEERKLKFWMLIIVAIIIIGTMMWIDHTLPHATAALKAKVTGGSCIDSCE